MENIKKVAIAMSGGVDSSVAAALLTEEYGKENVFGVTMRLFCYGGKGVGPKNCCSLDAINDAKAVCKKLGIKHYVLDFEKEFEREVIENFVSEYLEGRTPNPCVRCNSIIKFDYLLEKAKGLGADFLATGHYARIEREIPNNKFQITNNSQYPNELQITNYKLQKGRDEKKDQSYFLYGMTQEQLRHTLFPLGEYTKDKVRNLAKKYGLGTAEKVESQEICFIQSADYRGWIMRIIEDGFPASVQINEGEIVDKYGNVLGRHKGLPFYTIGQRRGIGNTRIYADGTRINAEKKPLYVTEINVIKNQLIVGEEKDLYKKEFEVGDLNWISGKGVVKEFKADVMIRYNMKPAKATIYPSREAKRSREASGLSTRSSNTVKVIFEKPQKAITPGQSAVFFSKDEVLGGGVIIFIKS